MASHRKHHEPVLAQEADGKKGMIDHCIGSNRFSTSTLGGPGLHGTHTVLLAMPRIVACFQITWDSDGHRGDVLVRRKLLATTHAPCKSRRCAQACIACASYVHGEGA